MAFPNPRHTWLAGETVTAALMEAEVHAALDETAPAKVTTAGDLVYATAARAIARLGIGTAKQLLRTNAGANAPEWGATEPATGQIMGAVAAGHHVESGSASLNYAGGNVAITFADAFGSAPIITLGHSVNSDSPSYVDGINGSGATIRLVGGGSGSNPVYWMAEGAD